MATLPLLVVFEGHPRQTFAFEAVPEEIVEEDAAAPLDYEESFARLHRRAYDVAYRLLGSRAEAEDVAQEALARAFVHWPGINTYAEPWTVRVAANLAIGTWRKRRRLSALPAEALAQRPGGARAGSGERARPDGGPADEDGHPQHVLVDHLELRSALGRLSRRQREVVVLRHLAGFSERDTALALGCAEGTVKAHAARGLATLRRLLEASEDGDRAGDGRARRRPAGERAGRS
jgi:RNA polymerase sigma factor (sigma-70 family)